MSTDNKIYDHKKLLILSMFKNSNMWARNVLLNMHNIYRFNDTLYDEDINKLHIYFSFIDGMSTDETFSTLTNYCKNGDVPSMQILQLEHDNIVIDSNDPYTRYKKLAIIRNDVIEQSTKNISLKDNDYILFADSDIKFRYDIVYELIKDMENCGADIIAPMIYIENFREFGNSYFYDTLAFRWLDGKNFDHLGLHARNIDVNIPNEVSSVGSFYVMKYKVAKTVKYTGEKDSEQVEFCNSARSTGFKVFISPRLSVLHINLDNYGLKWH